MLHTYIKHSIAILERHAPDSVRGKEFHAVPSALPAETEKAGIAPASFVETLQPLYFLSASILADLACFADVL